MIQLVSGETEAAPIGEPTLSLEPSQTDEQTKYHTSSVLNTTRFLREIDNPTSDDLTVRFRNLRFLELNRDGLLD